MTSTTWPPRGRSPSTRRPGAAPTRSPSRSPTSARAASARPPRSSPPSSAWRGAARAGISTCREQPVAGRTRLTGQFPCYRVYECADGRFLSVGALEPKFWSALVEALDRPELLARHLDPSPEAHAEVEAVFLKRSRDDWAARFEGLDVCVEPVLEPAEVELHPQVAARRLIRHEATGTEVAPAVPLEPGWRRLDPPGLGQHNLEVLGEVGVDAARLAELAAAGVV